MTCDSASSQSAPKTALCSHFIDTTSVCQMHILTALIQHATLDLCMKGSQQKLRTFLQG